MKTGEEIAIDTFEKEIKKMDKQECEVKGNNPNRTDTYRTGYNNPTNRFFDDNNENKTSSATQESCKVANDNKTHVLKVCLFFNTNGFTKI